MNNLPNQPEVQMPLPEPPAATSESQDVNDLINSKSYQGSIQQILLSNLGAYVIINFLIGTNNIVTKEGILYTVGISYIVLHDEKNDQYIICDLYAIKFVTYVNSQQRPARPTMSRNIRR